MADWVVSETQPRISGLFEQRTIVLVLEAIGQLNRGTGKQIEQFRTAMIYSLQTF
jgi:hypothetical protein